MKNIIISIMVAATILSTSCIRDEFDGKMSNKITFTVGSNQITRADVITTNDLTEIEVKSYSSDDNSLWNTFNLIKSGDTWTYGDDKYHPITTLYHFSTLPIQNYVYSNGSIKFNYEANNEHDLIGVGVSSTSSTANNINLTYNHLLSKVKFNIAASSLQLPNGWKDAGIEDIKLSAIKSVADCTIGNDNSIVWDNYSESKIYDFTTENLMVIPQDFNMSESTISFTIYANHDNSGKRTIQEEVELKLSDISNGKWLAGKSYVYTVDFKKIIEDKIDDIRMAFNVSVTEWGEDENIVIDIE